MRITVPPLWNIKGFINLHPPIINVCSFVVFYFSLFCSVQNRDSLCCHFLSRLVRTSSNGQEAVWFFCSTVIRPPFLFPANAMQSISKYCLPWLKTAHYLWLFSVWFKPPQSNVCNPERRRNCHPKEDLPFSYFRAHPLQNWMLNFRALFS